MTSPDLIERLEKAEGPVRQIDREIAKAIDPTVWKRATNWASMPCGAPPDIIERDAIRWVPAYTTSLDAALALAERVLGKGWSYSIIGEIGGGATVTLEQPDVDLGGGVIASPGLCGLDEFEAEAATPALALCAAILRSRGEAGR